MHYDPALDNTTTASNIPTTTSKRRTKTGYKSDTSDAPAPKVRRKRKGKEKAVQIQADELDENWERAIKTKILQDIDLHHRILRYEVRIFVA